MFKITARTVLELGAELISSDIIAFYELVKNCFDAKSKTGADIRFKIVISKGEYLKIRNKLFSSLSDEIESGVSFDDKFLSKCKSDIASKFDPKSEAALYDGFIELIESAENLAELIELLDEGYRRFNIIEISDTGSGMSMTELKNNYLVIGTPSRKREIDKAIAAKDTKTPFLGEKGIGRLSVMRLGELLRLETSTKDDQYINTLNVDWRLFNDVDAMIGDIQIKPKKKIKAKAWHGTLIKISDLTSSWSESTVRELADYEFARVTDPFVDSLDKPRMAIFWNGVRIGISRMDQALLDHAHAKFSGKYSIKNDEPALKVKMEAFDLGFEHGTEVELLNLSGSDLDGMFAGLSQNIPLAALEDVGEFSFEAYWYNRRRLVGIDSIGNQEAVRKLQKKWSGILLFRDGFRVFPYGDDDDDWLGLDRRALGRPGYALNKMQFVGHVNITRIGNPNLLDQTNREGLRKTPEQQVFLSILQGVIQNHFLDFLKDVERRNKKQPLDLVDAKVEINQLESRAKNALSRVRKLVPKDALPVVDDLQLAFDEFRDLSDRARRRIEEVEEDSHQMLQMAGVGLMVEVIAHELARASESALSAIENLRGKELPLEIKAKLETLKSEMRSVSKRLRILDNLSVSGRQRSEVFDVSDVVEDLREGHKTQFQRHNVTFEFRKTSLKIRAVKGFVIQILENLISNSIYWMNIRAEKERAYSPKISIFFESDPPTIYFKDNGPGISPDNKEKIFRPFWSLKEKSKRRGLGLYIARENANYLGGQLSLSDEKNKDTGRLHQFVLELPESVQQK